jgi:hypothetical protein
MIRLDTDIDSAVVARGRQRALIEGRGPRVSELFLNPYRFGGGADPFYSSVQALLHMDGANGSATFTDQKGGTFTRTGNAQISTAQSQWGGASGLFDGSGDYVSRTYSTALFDWWTTDFVVEVWLRPTSFASAACVIGNMTPTGPTNFWSFGTTNTGLVQFGYYNGSVFNTVTSSGAISTGAWTHCLMIHNSGTIKVGFGGNFDGSGAVSGTPQSSAATNLVIGQVNNVCWNGYMDDLRITKGAGAIRYSGSTYTVPAAAFPNF